MSALLARLVASRLFWPIVMLLVLFAINLIAFPGFFAVTLRDGHLFGSLVDILRNGAPTLIIAVGMTLVIATRGIDLSVGAVAAIAGAVACSIILGSPEPANPVSYTHLRAHETSLHLVCRLLLEKNFFLMIRRPPRSTPSNSSAASDVYKRQS